MAIFEKSHLVTLAKGHAVAKAVLKRCSGYFKKLGLDDFTSTYVTTIGNEECFGENARYILPRETTLWMAVQHKDKKALEFWSREIASAGTIHMIQRKPEQASLRGLFEFTKKSIPMRTRPWRREA